MITLELFWVNIKLTRSKIFRETVEISQNFGTWGTGHLALKKR